MFLHHFVLEVMRATSGLLEMKYSMYIDQILTFYGVGRDQLHVLGHCSRVWGICCLLEQKTNQLKTDFVICCVK